MSNAMWYLRKNRTSTFTLQLTSMIDMFTIILVFLLKSYATSAVDVVPGKDVTLPSSTSTVSAIEALKVVVSQKGIFVDDKQILAFEDGKVPAGMLDAQDKKFIKPLFDALKEQADKTKSISKQNETVNFEGKVILQADRALSYDQLSKVLYTSAFAGYTNVNFAVAAIQ
jgi:biopolymer transport protein ExbD